MPDEGHQMAGLGYTEEQRFADFLERDLKIESLTAEMNAKRRDRDDLQRLQDEEQKPVKAWLKLQADQRATAVISTGNGEQVQMGAAVETKEKEEVNVYRGGVKVAKAVAREAAGEDLPDAAFPPPPRPRGRPPKSADEPTTLTDVATEVEAQMRAAGHDVSVTVVDTTAVPTSEAEVLAAERAKNAERRKAAADTMRATGYPAESPGVAAARAQRSGSLGDGAPASA